MIRRRHLLVLPLLALFAGADAPQARSARAEVDFNFGWRFQLDGTPGAAHAVSPALRTGNATRSCLRAESSQPALASHWNYEPVPRSSPATCSPTTASPTTAAACVRAGATLGPVTVTATTPELGIGQVTLHQAPDTRQLR